MNRLKDNYQAATGEIKGIHYLATDVKSGGLFFSFCPTQLSWSFQTHFHSMAKEFVILCKLSNIDKCFRLALPEAGPA